MTIQHIFEACRRYAPPETANHAMSPRRRWGTGRGGLHADDFF
ncbi:hypothetical protein HMPREF9568_01158 [Cutibacterium acnes HL013PA2]|nr:hypothetical protein HMPREF9575_00991 [Cutibacterium acnes HL110PA1]EFS90669.1 hypothetical protein HMPREF9606_00256 [Cutibacterium acnes HL036PA3]EFT21420.1 hypothetical protein HMPREF9566_01058 [Cutibacterium acnes HL045PA1]EFT24612.1 hypothetical protein HMPREF9573_00089 [Cutibacterium acnes HL072PA2]EFT54610.1 hypothetical protein HMPREF9610_02570 [Cutibacterium acnes HL027PA2]EGE92050.1 hypothetical protein HMPREF9568_01158 [Cutibacterium acnes HL013PA2]